MPSRRGFLFSALLSTGLVFCLGCTPEAAPIDSGPRAVLDIHEFMADVLDPATDRIWAAAGTIETLDGSEDLAPKDAAGWLALKQAAAVVAESGNLLLVPGRKVDDESWREYSLALRDLGVDIMAAAERQDADAVFDLGGTLYNLCVACHLSYNDDTKVAPADAPPTSH